MAREPVQLNTPVSSGGQVSNRAAYMRPAFDRSGSKALASALGSLSGSLSQFNAQVDRYQNAQRQAQLEEAQRFQNQEVAKLSLQGSEDGALGRSSRGSALQDSPVFQAAYQEGHLDASIRRRLTELERNTNWEGFNADVDAGHDKLQAFLLEQSEGLLEGYTPEVQAKLYPSIRNWANGKMNAQAIASKERRITNMQEDLTATIENQLALGEGPDAIRAAMEEQMNILSQVGVVDPSGKAAQSLIDAAILSRDPDAINQVLADDEFSKQMLNSEARMKLMTARDQLEAQERAVQNLERSEYNKAFLQTTASVQLEAMQALSEGNSRQAIDAIDGMLAQAYDHPDTQVGLSAVKALDAMKKAVLTPPKETLDPTTEYQLRMQMDEELSMAAARGEGQEALTAISARYIELGVSPSNAVSSTKAAFSFAEAQFSTFEEYNTAELSVITGALASANSQMPETSQFLGIGEADINKNSVASFVRMQRAKLQAETEQIMLSQFGPEWRSSISRDEILKIDRDITQRAYEAAGLHFSSQIKVLLDNGTTRSQLLSSPVVRKAVTQMIGQEEMDRYRAMTEAATAEANATAAARSERYQ